VVLLLSSPTMGIVEKQREFIPVELGDRVKRERKLLRLFTTGLSRAKTIGYHATSLEAIEHLLVYGGLSGITSTETPNIQQVGDLYFYPQWRRFPRSHHLVAKEGFFHEDWERADRNESPDFELLEGYASDIARKHRFIRLLGLNMEDSQTQYLAQVLSGSQPQTLRGNQLGEYNEFFLELRSRGYTAQQLQNAIQDSTERKGLILGLHRAILALYSITPGDEGGDLRINVFPNGLPVAFLSGILALGSQEKTFFHNLHKI